MIIEEVAPTLTCVAARDGFQYELLLRADPNFPAITKIRIGPYIFKPEYQPTNSFISLRSEGPDSGFWMNKSTPRGWSPWRWEQDKSLPDQPWYLVSKGVMSPGQQGLFKFISMYAPGGLRAGMELFRGTDHNDYGVTGPNFEHFLIGGDVH
jgi:hypothetical protein